MQSEDLITELFDSYKYSELKIAYDNLIPFEQREVAEIIEEALNTEFQNGYKKSENESKWAHDDGFEDGFEDGFVDGLQKALTIIKQKSLIFSGVYLLNEIIKELERQIKK